MTRADFAHFEVISTRWDDEDYYGHINNVKYYSFFDTAVNGFLMRESGADIRLLDSIGLVVESKCEFKRELKFPQDVEVGLAVGKVGNSSIVYNIAIFQGDFESPAGVGHFVHVYVDRRSRTVTTIPDIIRESVKKIEHFS
ncbi:MAG: acyl-CoA thioesterase [Aeromicrobium sp.]|nr:MAG: acyl-CoA thioesterase [Aeromicrobium sp.]